MTLQLHENTAEQHLCLLGDEKLLADPICEHLSTGQSARKGVAGVEKRERKGKRGKKREAEQDAANVASNPTDLLRWFEARTTSELNLFAVSPPPRSPPTFACLSSSSY